ncbi:MAG: GNAT family N-acetyltransferase [Rubrobacteraceae bacterium]
MTATSFEIETPRLRLRPCTMADVDALHRLWTDPQVRKFLWDDVEIARDQAASAVQSSIECFGSHGFGYWVVLTAEEGSLSPIGFCGLRFFGEPPGEIELLYGIAPPYWGRGLATEAAEALLRFGFEECGFERVYAGADPPNKGSLRVIEKLGMAFDRSTRINGREAIYHVISREALDPEGPPRTRSENGP